MSAPHIPSGSHHHLWTLADDAFAAIMSGSWVAMFLCGICVAQAYYYFHEYPEDGLWTKVAAWMVTLMNTINAVLVCGVNYFYLVKTAREQDIHAKARVTWTLPAAIGTHMIISVVVFMYYIVVCYYLLARKKCSAQKVVMIVLILAPIMAHVGLGIASVGKICETKSLFDVPSFRKSIIIPMLSTQVAAEIAISSALCFALPKPTHQACVSSIKVVLNHLVLNLILYRRTRNVTRSIILYIISRGFITAAAALVELLMLVLAPKDLWFISIEFIIPGLYANSFFSALNTRRRIRRHLANNSDVTPPMAIPLGFYRPPTDIYMDERNMTGDDNSTLPRDGIQVEVYTIQKRDEPSEKV
ncbi:hypothetical protein BDY19DRAFT_346337 [Irpex rosettiformis]|uniref:Uncharacterized protein n=1 Tax=Irpex rosettiformis TaxID=378272 RepID=A0ACB8TWZ4_9APHY|nr:hypothetical protein BDY19DRAFT_346337 [Irpex rosettiformis]